MAQGRSRTGARTAQSGLRQDVMSVITPAGQLTAPVAPGQMGSTLDARAAEVYVGELGRWRDARRRELDELDKAALQAANGTTATGDILLSMALWKAVSDRYELLRATWSSGRVGVTELTRMSTLIWGRLDASAASGLSVSLPEACRLSDALLSQLRVKLGLDPSGWRSPNGSGSCVHRWNVFENRSTSSRRARHSSRRRSSSPDWHAD